MHLFLRLKKVENFVEAHLCKLLVIVRSRVFMVPDSQNFCSRACPCLHALEKGESREARKVFWEPVFFVSEESSLHRHPIPIGVLHSVALRTYCWSGESLSRGEQPHPLGVFCILTFSFRKEPCIRATFCVMVVAHTLLFVFRLRIELLVPLASPITCWATGRRQG